MKNQYFGDKRDLFKFHLVLHSIESLALKALTYVPMLTSNDDPRQGSLTDYPKPPCHGDLYEFLQQAVRTERDIRGLRGFFATKDIRYQPYRDETQLKESDRAAYFDNIPGDSLQDALILFDPDTGLEIDRRSGAQYLRYDELRHVLGRASEKSVLMVFQYLYYPNDYSRISKIQERVTSELRRDGIAGVAECHEGNVAFFLAAKSPQVFEALKTVTTNYPVNQQSPLANAMELKHKELTERIIGVFYDVYNQLGHGFLESVYRNAMEMALRDTGLRVEHEVGVPVWFRGRDVGDFRIDLLVEGCVLLELKTAQTIDRTHEAQVMNYLRATEVEVGVLLNSGPKPQFKRFVFENQRKKIRVHPRESAVGNS